MQNLAAFLEKLGLAVARIFHNVKLLEVAGTGAKGTAGMTNSVRVREVILRVYQQGVFTLIVQMTPGSVSAFAEKYVLGANTKEQCHKLIQSTGTGTYVITG